MSSKKLSGAQNRKRKMKAEKEISKSKKLMQCFLTQPTKEEEETEVRNEEVVQERCIGGTCDKEFHSHTDTEQENIPKRQIDELTDNSDNITKNVIPEIFNFNDVAYLTFDKTSKLPIISQQLRTEMILHGSDKFQNKLGSFAVSGGRSMTTSWFTRRLANSNEINRSWLLYSPSNQAAYCFCCLLFTSSNSNTRSSFETSAGFCNWKKSEKLRSHENSLSHRQSFTTWKETERRVINRKGIDAELELQIQTEKQRWLDVLDRILACIKFLVAQNLPLRGHFEKLTHDDKTNVGNFLSLLKLIAQYDPLLANHLKHITENPRSVSYLSPQIQNEFLKILASTVRNKLITDINRNKYYGILLDSTPDVTHREQMSQVMRYVDIDFVNKKVTIKESFLGYIMMHAKDAATIETVIEEKLKSDEIPLANCRSQCYDNAAVMSGYKSGVQQRILEKNPRALFVNCDNHSLNLVGLTSAKQDSVVITFFGTIESIYLFFSRSTLRWQKMKNAVKKTVKRESETRWSARAEAVSAIYEDLDELVELLETMSEDVNQTHESRSEAENLLKNILNYNFIVLIHFWHHVLRKFDRVQKRLQDPTMNFMDASCDLESLALEVNQLRDDLCEEALTKAKTKCEEWGIEIQRRIRSRRKMPGETAEDAGLSAEEEIKRIMKSVVDNLQTEIKTRFTRLKDLNEKFGFLLDVKNLLRGENLEGIQEKCINFGKIYDTDIVGIELFNEICDCKMLLQTREDVLPETPLDLLTFIICYGEDVFPNLRTAIQILLTIAVSIASCERSFSKLKLILTYLRASMGQDRLTDLALLSIEKDTLEKINFREVIDQFAALKSRKAHM